MTNIAEILKDAPKGLKLYSPLLGNVYVDKIINNGTYRIQIIDTNKDMRWFMQDGRYINNLDDAECILFPSKEHKSWDNWQEVLFQSGDVIVSQNETPVGLQMFLCYENDDRGYLAYGVGGGKNYITPSYYRYATPEEREQFFNDLNRNGYTWNNNTKQIEKSLQNTPKYKIGDYIIRNSGNLHTVAKVNEIVTLIGYVTHYRLFYFESSCTGDYSLKYIESNFRLATEQELIDAGIKEKLHKFKSNKHYVTPNRVFFNWIYDRLVKLHGENPNVDYMLSLKERIDDLFPETEETDTTSEPTEEKSFTIEDLKPFDKVLVKYDSYSKWGIDFFERYDYNSKNNTPGPYICLSSSTHYCIPYNNETKHLLGTTDDCPDKYKTWGE